MEESLKLKILKGSPLLLKKSNLFFYHRTINEIIDYGYLEFLKTVQLFLTQKDDLQSILPIQGITPFLYFLIAFQNDSEISQLLRKGFNFFVNIDDIKSDIQNKVFVCSLGEIEGIEINEEGFMEIIEYIAVIYNGTNAVPDDDSNLSEQEKKMKKRFEELKKLREKVKHSEDSEGSSEFSDMIGGFLSRNMNMGFKEVMELPYFTFFFLLKKLKNYDEYELQLKAMLAGAKIEKNLHHWLQGGDDE